MTAPLNILLVNGNTTEALTRELALSARRFYRPDYTIVAAAPRVGPRYIASRAEATIAAHGILETVAGAVDAYAPGQFDACVLACFGEPGIGAVRELHSFPVVGMAEASVLSALQSGDRFAIVTVGERWPGMLGELLRQTGLERRSCAILALPGQALDLASKRDEALSQLRAAVVEAIERHHADVVIIGGAALAGFAAALQPEFKVPLIDSLQAALAQAEALARLSLPAARRLVVEPLRRTR
ncbi:MAG: aspartate/glutamate racemase family protein [Proteobacteria bacterium]|nr:aspartate/glutamate racemase family protein [Pseudomonadota bacterium]MBI3499583.1 aspartate/glutamate racemase family protein [Pseudomonadota bacterium]